MTEKPTREQLRKDGYLPTYDQSMRIWMSKHPEEGKELMRLDYKQGYADWTYDKRKSKSVTGRPDAQSQATWELLSDLKQLPNSLQATAEMLSKGISVTDIARSLEVSRQTVHRYKRKIASELQGLGYA